MSRAPKFSILVIDEHPFVAALLQDILEKGGYSAIDICAHYLEAEQRFKSHKYDLVLIADDLKTGPGSSLDLLVKFVALNSRIQIIFIAETGAVERTVMAMRRGASFVLEKPLHPEKVLLTLNLALEMCELRGEVERLKSGLPESEEYHGMVGTSSAMKKVFGLIERIKGSSVNVLITGPSGSGKEMIARALHDTSNRADQNFVAVNCSAIPENLLEAELFGYKKGAFTDAKGDKDGLFTEANGGTLFLDEIGDMPLAIQPKLLRAIQEREVRPLGGVASIKIDVRIIAATNQSLVHKIEEKIFREDLYYRLNAMQIELPTLALRMEDVPLLVDYFLKKNAIQNGSTPKKVTPAAMKRIMSYGWPGNIRELQNVLERAVLLSGAEIEPQDLSFQGASTHLPEKVKALDYPPLEDIEKEHILRVLAATSGNRTETALILGIGRKTLYNKLAKYGM